MSSSITASFKTAWAKAAALPKVYVAAGVLGISLIVAVAATSVTLGLAANAANNKTYQVAFVGNRFLAINDLPRLMESLSEGKWTQQSCLHQRGSLVSLLETGNGMLNLWQTDAALLDDDTGVHDYGACTVEQLFRGSDGSLLYQDANSNYYDDGRNPCFHDDDYYTYQEEYFQNQTRFDFVVLSDHAKRMAVDSTRALAIGELKLTYATYLEDDGAIPVVCAPHAFWSQNANMTGLVDIATFTSLIYDAALEYADTLSTALPDRQKARVAPIGLAFLTVYEEDPDLWSLLTDSYDIHPSVFGSYLIGCVLYATVTGKMPDLGDDLDVEPLFDNARYLTGATDWGYPNPEQVEYLWDVARRVVKHGYKPSSLELY